MEMSGEPCQSCDCPRDNVIRFQDEMTHEGRVGFATRTIADCLRLLDKECGSIGATRITILLLLEVALERGEKPHSTLYKGILQLADFYRPEKAA